MVCSTPYLREWITFDSWTLCIVHCGHKDERWSDHGLRVLRTLATNPNLTSLNGLSTKDVIQYIKFVKNSDSSYKAENIEHIFVDRQIVTLINQYPDLKLKICADGRDITKMDMNRCSSLELKNNDIVDKVYPSSTRAVINSSFNN